MNRVSIPEDIARRAGAVVKPESRSGGDTLTTVPAAPIPAPILETKFSDSPGVKQLSIALIGPNEPRRWDVSSVLAECRGITVREFSSYPTALDDVPRLLERYFDVIIVDLDSDPEFAPKLVSTISTETSATVMVYSEKADRELMARCVRAGAREYLVLPFDQSTLGKALDRARIELDSKAPSKETADGDLLVFFGAKGGAGVTTVACNLALALAREPDRKTLLIDLAVPMGDAALNLGIAAEYSTDDALREADRLDGRQLLTLLARHRSGVFVLAAPSQVSEVDPPKAAIDKLVAVARQQFDHVVVDVGSRIDLMGADLFKGASRVYLVTQAGISELRNSNRLISQFFGEGGPRLEIVLNRFAPHPQAGVNEEVVAKALGRPVRWKIPDDHDATRQMQSTATAFSSADSPISRLILEMAGSVTGNLLPEELSAFQENQGSTAEAGERGAPDASLQSSPETSFATNLDAALLDASIEPEFTPKFQTASNVVLPTVHSGAPATIAWPAPDPISFGTALSAAQLNATASVQGTLIYTPGTGYVLPVGTHTLWATFNAADSGGSAPVQSAVSITVSKAMPALAWPAPPDIRSGSGLTEAHLNATASVPGEFVYHPALGEVLGVGTHVLSVAFIPADSANYTTSDACVAVTVSKQTPTLQWLESEAMVYGEALSSAQLNASASVPGTFAYTPGEGALLAAGVHTPSVVFTPEDTETYETGEAVIRLTVGRATPVISWPKPEPILCGEALSIAQLNATASVPGTFHYSHTIGELLAPGSRSLDVTFTPTDGLNLTVAKATVEVTVIETTPTPIFWQAPSAIPYGTALGDAQLNATALVSGTFVYAPSAGHVMAPGKYTLSASFTPEDLRNHSPAHATVELQVGESENVAWPLAAPEPAPLTLTGIADEDAPANPAPDATTNIDSPPQTPHRETRSYRGAMYEKGEDGQWHLQQT